MDRLIWFTSEILRVSLRLICSHFYALLTGTGCCWRWRWWIWYADCFTPGNRKWNNWLERHVLPSSATIEVSFGCARPLNTPTTRQTVSGILQIMLMLIALSEYAMKAIRGGSSRSRTGVYDEIASHLNVYNFKWNNTYFTWWLAWIVLELPIYGLECNWRLCSTLVAAWLETSRNCT